MPITRYVQPKVPPPSTDLDKALEHYHRVLEESRVNHNLIFGSLYKPFNWPKEKDHEYA